MQKVIIASTVAAAAATDLSFSEWTKTHSKSYASREELMLRRSIYAANVAKVNQHNSEGHSWKMAVNKFADLTADEFAARFTGSYRSQEKRSKNVNLNLLLSKVEDLPATVDWTAAGAVTPIKNQGQCGSCYAFSTTGSTEGINFIKTKTLVSVSEQQIVDCSGAEGNNGCNGGLMDYGFQFIINNNGICTEDAYPYQAVQNACVTTCTPAVTITGFTDVPTNSEQALMTAVAQQPVSVAVEADQSVFQFYSSGVMTDPSCGTALDHGVLAVGYGTLNGQDFWKVKNSWGADWGSDGYIYLGRGDAFNPNGQCGIQMQPSYPTKN